MAQNQEEAVHGGEARVRVLKNQLRALMDNVVDGLVLIGEDGIVQAFNPTAQRMFGYAAPEVVGHNVSMLMPEPDRNSHDGYLANYLRTGEARIIGIGREVTGRRKDGTCFPMELAVGEMPGEQTHGFVGIIRDVTQRKELEHKLRQSYKMDALGQLTGGVAHDFNNLLGVLSMNLESLEELVQGQEAPLDLVRESRDAVRSATELIQSLLTFARRQEPEPKEIDPRELVIRTAGLLRRTLHESIDIDVVDANDLWRVRADPAQFENALINLGLNARDAMPAGGRLTIESKNTILDPDYIAGHPDAEAGEYVSISITDTGEGMSRDVADRVFEPFFTTKPGGVGNGLGLSMVYGFVKQSGGHVAVYSEVGRGTSVNFYLPRATQSRPSENAVAAPGEIPGGSESILVVEDFSQLRKRTTRILRALGYRVVEAENGMEALACLDADPHIELIFTDIVMPGGMTGRELVALARQRAPGIRVLYTSGYADNSAHGRDPNEPGAGYLQKPFTRRDLALSVRRALEQSHDPGN